jgi:hypothetical protein
MPDDLGHFAQAALSRAASVLWDGRRERYAPSVGHHARFVAALLSGGDSRVAIDPHSGTNKYACPPIPAPDLVCFSSCTASPISWRGFERAGDCYDAIACALSASNRVERLRLLYDHLARDSILLGQPVDLGSFGGLRIAIGARDLLDGAAPGGLDLVLDALVDTTVSPGAWRRDTASGRC